MPCRRVRLVGEATGQRATTGKTGSQRSGRDLHGDAAKRIDRVLAFAVATRDARRAHDCAIRRGSVAFLLVGDFGLHPLHQTSHQILEAMEEVSGP